MKRPVEFWSDRLSQPTARRHLSLSARVYESLFEAILGGKVRPGEHLAEQPIAGSLGVSRISVREAIRRLATDGLVEIIPNRGAYVVDFSPADIEEIFSLRGSLEALGIRLATESAGRIDLARLEEVVDEMRGIEKGDDRLAGAEVDTKFHHTLMEISRHRRALEAWRSMSAQITIAVYNSITYYPDIDGLAERHSRIVDVIRSGDTEEAESCISDHIIQGGRMLLEAIGRDSLVERERRPRRNAP
ncbi:MAG: GntR family transcriptional regulator [Trueperaceae bacterium]